jgi:pSer/pThr/pTyr-binding forkhead associated (FHA) protein
MATLTFILEDGQEVEVPLTETITIGRSEGNSVVVDDDLISPRHAEILITLDGRMQVIEVDAGAGTFVNDLRVQSYPLRHGDRLAFGPLVALLDAEELPAEGDIATTNANQEAIAAQEKRLTELQAAADNAAARQAALITAIQSLVAEQEEKTATLKQLNLTHESVIQALKELTDQQAKEALCLKRLGEDKAQEEQRLVELRQLVATQEKNDSERLKLLEDQSKQTEQTIIEFNRQIETLKLRCHELETLAATQESQADAVSAEILKREQRALELKQDLLAAEAKLAQKLVENKVAEERNAFLSASLATLQEEYEELIESVEDLHQQLARHKADLIEQTRLVEIAKERHNQLEEDCRRLAINQQPPQEVSQDESIWAETKAAKVIESVPDLFISSFTTNRIVPRMVSSETPVPRPRGIPMKSERITRRGSPFPTRVDS